MSNLQDPIPYMADPPPGEDRFTAGSQVMRMRVLGGVAFTVSTIVFGLRVFTRLHLTKTRLRIDDYICGVAAVLCWVFYGLTTSMAAYGGAGRQFWQVTMDEYTNLLKLTIALSITYALTAFLAKLSILLFYLQVSPAQYFQVVVKTVTACLTIFYIIYIVMNLFTCIPVYAAWDLEAKKTAKCINITQFYLSAQITNVLIDGIVLLLPLFIIIPLQVPRRQKASLLVVLATGGFAVIAAVQNCILTPKLLKSTNYTWDLAYELLWFFAELAACVVCASASSLKPFFRRFIPQLFTSGLRYTNDSRDPTTGFSRGTNFRKSQMGRKPPDAYELESADDGDSARRVKGEDETRLWSGNPLRPQEDVDRSILISSDRDRTLSAMGRALSVRRSETPLDDDKGINVVREVRVAYGPP